MEERQRHHVIAIDGPAASGKSSVARELARSLGFVYVNSGAMYRAVTWDVLRKEANLDNPIEVARVVREADIRADLVEKDSRILIDGINPEHFLRTDTVNQNVSLVSSIPQVRERLVHLMRSYASDHDLVMEGRDIGSVVFPDTPYKFYVDAAPEVRAERRAAQGQADQIAARDRADSSRQTAPLLIAPDAQVIDTSRMSIAEVVTSIRRELERQGLPLRDSAVEIPKTR